jgi:hypothetical protein
MELCPAAKSGPGVKAVCSNQIFLPLTIPTESVPTESVPTESVPLASGPQNIVRVNEKPATMTAEERNLIESIFNSDRTPKEIIARLGQNSVTRESMRTLRPGVLVGDEPLNGFMHLLNINQAQNDHFSSFFCNSNIGREQL